MTKASCGLPSMTEQRRVRIIGPFVHFKHPRTFAATELRVIDGNCLAPWFRTGDVVWFDRKLEAKDGDLVVVSMLYRRKGFIGGDGALKRLDAVKQLRIVDGERFLCTRDDYVSADSHEILGPVEAWYRPGWWRRPSVKRMRLAGPREPCRADTEYATG